MRIYLNSKEMHKELERDLFEMGTRYQSKTVQDKNVADNPDFETIELMGTMYCLKSPDLHEILNVAVDKGISPDWLMLEAAERLNLALENKNPGTAWELNRDLWEEFIRDGVFSYSYAERWHQQIPYVINLLKINPHTRQALMTMYSTEKDLMNWNGRDRVPCSVSYHFLVRENKLNLIYYQRSCDFITFLLPDVYFSCSLLFHISEKTGIPQGDFIHFISSLHAFHKDLKDRNIF